MCRILPLSSFVFFSCVRALAACFWCEEHFYSVRVSASVFMALSTVFHSINSPLSHSVLPVSGFISVAFVLSAIYVFIKVSPSPDMILCG